MAMTRSLGSTHGASALSGEAIIHERVDAPKVALPHDRAKRAVHNAEGHTRLKPPERPHGANEARR